MSVSYTCPNPECGVTLKTATRTAAGKSVTCPKCKRQFVPEPDERAGPGPGTFKLADDPKPAAPSKKPAVVDDDEDPESVKKGYGVLAETAEEKEQAEKNKPKFEDAQEKFKKSARGPAIALLVGPSNLQTAAGLLTCVGGLVMFVVGMWPLVFNDAPPGEEELEEAIVTMLLGVCTLFWGAMVCFGTSQMNELSSYPWAMVGAVMAVPLLLSGLYSIIMLRHPKVREAFAEGDVLEDDEEKKDGDDDDEGDDDDDDDDDDE